MTDDKRAAIQIVIYRSEEGDVRFVPMLKATRENVRRGLMLQEERLNACRDRIAELIVMMEYFQGHDDCMTIGEVQQRRRG